MANRRMFSLSIIDTDIFLDMPITSRLLYYDLSMRADDDGFVSSPKRIQRMTGCSDDDFKLLIAKQFIIPFENGICVIKHWRIHNYIAKDRYNETIYKTEKSELTEVDGSYELLPKNECIQNVIQDVDKTVYNSTTQVRLGKDRLGKDRLGNIDTNKFVEKWNSLGLNKVLSIKNNRLKSLKARIEEFGEDKILEAMDNITQSSFLMRENDRGWKIDIDWLLKPNNFPKVLEGNYKDNPKAQKGTGFNNFKPRDYDYDSLEKKLLGWDKDD